MCRALFAFIDMHGIVGEVTMGMNNAIRASLIFLCIAMGVATPNIFFRSMTFPRMEQKLLDMLIERRKGHGLFVGLEKVGIVAQLNIKTAGAGVVAHSRLF